MEGILYSLCLIKIQIILFAFSPRSWRSASTA